MSINTRKKPEMLTKCTAYRKRGASLMVQWIRTCLPMQETQVWSLGQEASSGWGSTKPMGRNYWARALVPASLNYWARVLQLLKPVRLEPVLPQGSSCAARKSSQPLLPATRESLCKATKTQCSQINKLIKLKQFFWVKKSRIKPSNIWHPDESS